MERNSITKSIQPLAELQLPDFYEKYKAFSGRRYNSSAFMKVNFMEAYMTGIDVLNPV
jgi:hypothetical protein